MVEGLEEHNVKPPSMPASGKVFTLTVTVLLSAGHGASPLTV
jgi:hypothetical protein